MQELTIRVLHPIKGKGQKDMKKNKPRSTQVKVNVEYTRLTSKVSNLDITYGHKNSNRGCDSTTVQGIKGNDKHYRHCKNISCTQVTRQKSKNTMTNDSNGKKEHLTQFTGHQ